LAKEEKKEKIWTFLDTNFLEIIFGNLSVLEIRFEYSGFQSYSIPFYPVVMKRQLPSLL